MSGHYYKICSYPYRTWRKCRVNYYFLFKENWLKIMGGGVQKTGQWILL